MGWEARKSADVIMDFCSFLIQTCEVPFIYVKLARVGQGMVRAAFLARLIHFLHEDFQVELDRADRVGKLELLQHGRMQDAEDTDGLVLTVDVELDGCRVALQERGI